MLGRQQIANVSTAISELFKNAYDAYADHAEVDYFRSDNLLVIRDDGFGMTEEDFAARWLVLGTESKYSPRGTKGSAYRPTHKPERAVMGEKGIGRLAIALLGTQVLVLTRAERPDASHDLLMSFVHWGLFEISGLNLDEVEIPIHTISDGRLPGASEVEDLLSEVRAGVERLAAKHTSQDFRPILADIDDLQLDPSDVDEFLGGLSLKGSQSGTHFYIVPADGGIAEEIEREREKRNKDFTKFLLGFSNSVFREEPPPPIETAFRYWQTEAFGDDLIGAGEFFRPEELSAADHRVSGAFDAFGQFQGTVRIYEKTVVDHVIPWRGATGRPTLCGPFQIEFGYVAGTQRDSRLPPEDFSRITAKLDNIGGLYVYRDRIRVLPYGNSDVDWLDIEERRTKGAAYYFFSYRRLFGAVTLTREDNGRLKEKAGREGFQRDKAYRQLKDILENLFLQLAADFFRETGAHADVFSEQREELVRLDRARRRREKQVKTKRKNIAAALEGFFERVAAKLPETELGSLRDAVELRMKAAARMRDPDDASKALLDAEREANRRLLKIRESYRLSRPRGVGLPRTLQRDWNAYVAERDRLEEQVFAPFSRDITQTLGSVAREARLYVDQRKRLTDLIQQRAESGKKLVSQEAGHVRESANDTRSAAIRFARHAIQEFQETIAKVEVEVARKDLVGLTEGDIERLRDTLEGRIETVGRKNSETLSKIREMLSTMSANLAQGVDVAETDIVEAMDQELEELREQSEADAELVQLGLAIAVINHEFESAIKGVRRSLRELRPWASENEQLAGLYQEIRTNFEHLDGHLNLFTPLQRRLYRKAIPIKGADINHYVRALFEGRLKRHDISLETTQSFLDASITGFPSTIYPVFVNILDNAIFWLRDVPEGKRITLDARDSAFLISNNGPSVHPRDYEAIFEQGFTRKPGGRGLGLFISRRTLRKEGMDIDVLPGSDKRGVTMRVQWPKSHDNE